MPDRIDNLLRQWSTERPELDCSGLDVVARVQNLAKLLRRDEDRALATLGLKMSEYDVLSVLRRQGAPYCMPATELARESLLSTGAMTNRIDRLEARNLVVREDDPEDRRSVQIRLTAEGRALVDRALEARMRLADDQIADLSRTERTALASSLRKVLTSAQT